MSPSVAQAFAHFEGMASTPKKQRTVARVSDLRGEQTTVEEQVRIEKFIDSDEVEDEQWNDEFELNPGLDSRAVAEGKPQELDLCEQWDIYEPVAFEERMTLEDCKWVLRVEPDYSVRARLVTRQYKFMEHREDHVAPSSTSNASRIIDYTLPSKRPMQHAQLMLPDLSFKCLKWSCAMRSLQSNGRIDGSLQVVHLMLFGK